MLSNLGKLYTVLPITRHKFDQSIVLVQVVSVFGYSFGQSVSGMDVNS